MPVSPVTLADLVDPDDEETLFEFVLTQLAGQGWPTTAWQAFNVGLAVARIVARAQANESKAVAEIAKGGILGLAKKAWLTLKAKSDYDIDRGRAVFAVVHTGLVCSASAGPYSIAAGSLWMRTADGRKYNSANTVPVALASGGTLALDFRAESPGEKYNLPIGAAVELVTPLAGVTVTLTETFVGAGSCMTTPGEDEESDASLEQRCRARWATLGVEKTATAYAFLARNAKDAAGAPILGVTKVLVDDTNPDGPGTVHVYLGGDAGAIVDPGTVSGVNDYVQARKGLCATLALEGATNDNVQVTGTVKVKAAQLATVKAAIVQGLQALQASLDIGDGDGTPAVPRGILYRSAVEDVLDHHDGVVDSTLTLPASNYLPPKGHMAFLRYTVDGAGASITFVPV